MVIQDQNNIQIQEILRCELYEKYGYDTKAASHVITLQIEKNNYENCMMKAL